MGIGDYYWGLHRACHRKDRGFRVQTLFLLRRGDGGRVGWDLRVFGLGVSGLGI